VPGVRRRVGVELKTDFFPEPTAQGRQQGLARLDADTGRRPDDELSSVARELESAQQDPAILVQDHGPSRWPQADGGTQATWP